MLLEDSGSSADSQEGSQNCNHQTRLPFIIYLVYEMPQVNQHRRLKSSHLCNGCKDQNETMYLKGFANYTCVHMFKGSLAVSKLYLFLYRCNDLEGKQEGLYMAFIFVF